MTKKKEHNHKYKVDETSTPERIEEPVGMESEEELGITPEQAALEEIKMLQSELAETQAKANEYLDGWQRSRAEFANYKKRIEREQAEIYQRTSGSIIKRYLDVLDDLDLALKNRPSQGDGQVWSNGIELI